MSDAPNFGDWSGLFDTLSEAFQMIIGVLVTIAIDLGAVIIKDFVLDYFLQDTILGNTSAVILVVLGISFGLWIYVEKFYS